ncbi:MAG: pyruvate dehydrogenase (acetyl-transferring), homodimeric type, partial [Trebonia sp.]
RGNGKIIQELEAFFRGAGWNVIKVIWGRDWDPLLAQDTDGVLVNKMNTTPDGQFQTYSVESGAYIREHFFGSDPRLRKMVEHLSDDDLRNLSRGGHDYRKVYAAFKAAREHVGQPTVILTHTIKGWTLGKDFEARNATHQMKKLTLAELKEFRDRLYLPIPDSDLEGPDGLPPYYHPGQDSDEIQYMKERRAALGGVLPRRVIRAKPLPQPPDSVYQDMMKGSGKQSVATTMAFVRILKDLMKDPVIGDRFVPVIPDEARTFGMDSLFPTAKIYSPFGQTYEAVDRNLLLSYKESERGQILHEGISEAGAMGSVIAASTSYATHGTHMIPVYVFYSMFGWQRTGDEMWALGDQLGRGFLLGATAGRTTLTGEGLQHNDGHSVLLASVSEACVSYDPAWAYEVSVIVKDALRRMYDASPEHPDGENIFYYLTVYNEPYQQPAAPELEGLEEGILRGMYRYAAAPSTAGARILASGVAMPWALRARQLLAEDWGVAADVWSVTSWTELRRDALAAESHNLLHPEEEPRTPYVTSALAGAGSDTPVVAVSDWIRSVPDQISRWVPGSYTSLGTDGFGFSDTRPAARRFFHVDAESITLAVLAELARSGAVDPSLPAQAIAKYKLDLPVSEALS